MCLYFNLYIITGTHFF